MKDSLQKLLNYKQTDPDYVLTAFEYADEYADGSFIRGTAYGVLIGVIISVISGIIIYTVDMETIATFINETGLGLPISIFVPLFALLLLYRFYPPKNQ